MTYHSLPPLNTHTLESSLSRVCDPKFSCFFYSLARGNSRTSREGVQDNNIEGSKIELSSYLTKKVSIIVLDFQCR